MGYFVDKRYTKDDGTIVWRIVFDAMENGKRIRRNVSRKEWPGIGFTPQMTFEEAKERCRQLSANEWLKKKEDNRNKVLERLQKEDKQKSAFLPETSVKEFEEKVLPNRVSTPNLMSYWRACKRLIREVQLEPWDWFERPDVIYNHFRKKKYSPNYVQKLLRILNIWGHYISRKHGKAFYPIKAPNGFQREKIADAYYDNKKDGMTSDPLTPTMLQKASATGKLSNKNYNWLFYSVFFGLRPAEIDQLKDSSRWKVTKEDEMYVFWVYQPKLTSVPREKRWKLIPCVLPEQVAAVKMLVEGNVADPQIKAMRTLLSTRRDLTAKDRVEIQGVIEKRVMELMEFKRPIRKTMEKFFGKKVHLYGGRKNFLPMMLEHGYRLEDIAAWLGHTHIETSWKHYRDRLRVSFKKVG